MRKGKQRAFRMDNELWERFAQICERQDMTASQMIRRLIRETIERETDPPKPRDPKGKKRR